MAHHLIFEGAELSGKSWIMSQVYNFLEPKYNQSGFVLDGCHWFNCDVGIFGTKHGKPVIKNYLKIFNELKNKNILVEKLHISDMIYNKMYRQESVKYGAIEKKLTWLDFKIVLVTLPEDEEAIKSRLADRLKIYPHYKKILHEPAWYIKQQQEYLEAIKKSCLPYLILETDKLPDESLVKRVLGWLEEIN